MSLTRTRPRVANILVVWWWSFAFGSWRTTISISLKSCMFKNKKDALRMWPTLRKWSALNAKPSQSFWHLHLSMYNLKKNEHSSHREGKIPNKIAIIIANTSFHRCNGSLKNTIEMFKCLPVSQRSGIVSDLPALVESDVLPDMHVAWLQKNKKGSCDGNCCDLTFSLSLRLLPNY